MQKLADDYEKVGKVRPIDEAVAELERHDSLSLMEKLHDCQQPKWERILRKLVAELTDKTVRF